MEGDMPYQEMGWPADPCLSQTQYGSGEVYLPTETIAPPQCLANLATNGLVNGWWLEQEPVTTGRHF